MRTDNPFTLSFGKKPTEYISRISQTEEIINNFTNTPPVTQVYMITGVRGSGKTVMLSELSRELSDTDWIVIELNPSRDMLASLTSKLYADSRLHKMFVQAKFNFSVLGIGASFEETPPITDYETAISKMLTELKKKGKRVLITVDEAMNSEYIRQFTSAFQIFVREDLPAFLLMTGLYDNIYNLQNADSLTFLYRAPKIVLEPLNLSAVKASYKELLSVDDSTAKQLAALTKGYPFAYQLLGYLMWNDPGDISRILPKYDQYLQEYVYEKLWSELSAKDRTVVIELAKAGKFKIKDLRAVLGMSSPEFSVYRDRLKKKGLIETGEYGYLSLALPRFSNYVNDFFVEL